jgi:hypothetical protein
MKNSTDKNPVGMSLYMIEVIHAARILCLLATKFKAPVLN